MTTNRAEETKMIAKFLQGGLAMLVHTQDSLRVAGVEQETDEAGIYRDYFTVVTESGLRVRVTVEPEPTT